MYHSGGVIHKDYFPSLPFALDWEIVGSNPETGKSFSIQIINSWGRYFFQNTRTFPSHFLPIQLALLPRSFHLSLPFSSWILKQVVDTFIVTYRLSYLSVVKASRCGNEGKRGLTKGKRVEWEVEEKNSFCSEVIYWTEVKPLPTTLPYIRMHPRTKNKGLTLLDRERHVSFLTNIFTMRLKTKNFHDSFCRVEL